MMLSDSPSEDVSFLLVAPESHTLGNDSVSVRHYLPDPCVDWVATYELAGPIPGDQLRQLFTPEWLEANGKPVVYGFSPESESWTYVSAANAPKWFSKLKIAWPLWDGIAKRLKNITAQDLENYCRVATAMIAEAGEVSTVVDRSAEEALAKMALLPTVVKECNQDVVIRLMAPEGSMFDGRELWDVMLCLGLEYGDGDLFHWMNNSGVGEDQFFSVETSTSPGYFIPESMDEGEGDVEDLLFSFSIPRSTDPLAVFDSLVKGVEYVQKRLGGDVVYGAGGSSSRESRRKSIASIVEKLKDAGFTPGASATCRVF